MNQLIHSGPSITMTSREIASITGRRHDNVAVICRELQASGVCPEIQETPYVSEQNGQTYKQFVLNKRDSLVLVARLSPEFTARVIDRWQELEAAVSTPAFQVPTTLSGALRLAAEQAERIEEQQKLIEQQKPAVEFVDRYVNAATGEKGFREVCKILGANEARFREFLVAERIMYRLQGRMMAYQNHIDAGRFRITTGISEDTNHAYTNVKMTPKGVEWIAGEWAKHQLSRSGLLN